MGGGAGDSAAVIVGVMVFQLFYTCFLLCLIKVYQCRCIVDEYEYDDPEESLESLHRQMLDDDGEDEIVVSGGGSHAARSVIRSTNADHYAVPDPSTNGPQDV